jgi:3-hydroxybutyryl-CoA dehydratase
MQKGDTFHLQFEVSDRIYTGFTELFRDKNPLHMDDGYAREHGFRERVMYGNILNGFISYFIGECLPVRNVVLVSQDIKYANPVYRGDVLAFDAVIEDVFDSVGIAEFKYTFASSGGVKVAKGTIQVRIL